MRLRTSAGVSTTFGMLTSLLETPKIKREVPWWVMALGAGVITLTAMFVEKDSELAPALDGLAAGFSNAAMEYIMEASAEKSQKLEELERQIQELQARVP